MFFCLRTASFNTAIVSCCVMAIHALKSLFSLIKQTCRLYVRMFWIGLQLILVDACDKYLSAVVSVFVSTHSGLSQLDIYEGNKSKSWG